MIMSYNGKSASAARPESEQVESYIQTAQQEIIRLKRFSNRGLWALALFLLISLLAWHVLPFLVIPEKLAPYFGKPPSVQVVSIALLVYTFSAIILSLARMSANQEHRSSFCHVGYMTVFFLFYHFAGGLDDNYWAVIGAGVTILGVESYRIWAYCNEAIRRKQEDLEFIRRTGRMPIED